MFSKTKKRKLFKWKRIWKKEIFVCKGCALSATCTRGPAQQHPNEATKNPLNKIIFFTYKNPFYFYNTSLINPQLEIITLFKIFKSVGGNMCELGWPWGGCEKRGLGRSSMHGREAGGMESIMADGKLVEMEGNGPWKKQDRVEIMSLAAADKLLKLFEALKNYRDGIPVADSNPLAKYVGFTCARVCSGWLSFYCCFGKFSLWLT